MPVLSSQARLFGLDLSTFMQEMTTAWRGMLAWPILAWLRPGLGVRLWLPEGQIVASRGPGTPHRHDDKLRQTVRFEAVSLPEHLLLRSVVSLPQLQSADLAAALALQVTGLSPFPANDLVWAHETESAQASTVRSMRVHLTLTSRRLVTHHIAQNHPDINASAVEVWFPSALTKLDQLMPGFGESVRLRKTRMWQGIGAFLVILALILVAAMAMTPTIQLWVRARQAQAAMIALQKKAAPVLQQRESLVRATDQLASLADMTGKTVPPLRALQVVTDALPDDTSVTSLQIQGLKVNLSGQTTDTTTLMKQLGATPGLRDVTAPSAAIKPLGAQRESFAIEFTLDPSRFQPTVPVTAK